MEVIGFILHAKISKKKSLKAKLEERFRSDYRLKFYETSRPRHAEALTEDALRDGCDFLVAVGGDGTLNEVVNAFLKSKDNLKTWPSLAVFPTGTGNDFARSIGMTCSVDQLYELIRKNQPRMLDAGSLSFTRTDGTNYVRYFDNIADVGIGAEVVAKVNGVHLRKKIFGGTLTFVMSALSTFLTYRHKKVRVNWGGQSYHNHVLGVAVANGTYFGSGLGIAPEARLDDGQFELIIMGRMSVVDYLRNFGRLRQAQKIDHPQLHYFRTSELTIEPSEDDKRVVVVEADGEIEGYAPLTYTCLPGALPFLVPGRQASLSSMN